MKCDKYDKCTKTDCGMCDENINDVLEQIKELREETTKDGKVFTVLEKYR